MKIRNDWVKRNAGGILREKVWKKGQNGRVKRRDGVGGAGKRGNVAGCFGLSDG